MDIKDIKSLFKFSEEKMQKLNLFETKQMFCDLYCLTPGQEQKVHSHDGNDKIYYVLAGRGDFTIGDAVQELVAGQTVCAYAGIDHGVRNNSSENLSCMVFMAPHPQPDKFG